MNEYQKKLVKDAGKNLGLIAISLAVVYMLSGGSLDLIKTFTEAAIVEKVFYIVFGIVIVYNLGGLLRVGVEYVKAGKGQVPNTQPVVQPVVNKATNNPIAEVIDYSQEEKPIFEKFDNFNLGLDISGNGLISDLRGKIESFYDNLDSLSLSELEAQYKDMEELRRTVNKEVSELYEQYKKLEQQMQLTLSMIRTKKVMGERIKQLRGR